MLSNCHNADKLHYVVFVRILTQNFLFNNTIWLIGSTAFISKANKENNYSLSFLNFSLYLTKNCYKKYYSAACLHFRLEASNDWTKERSSIGCQKNQNQRNHKGQSEQKTVLHGIDSNSKHKQKKCLRRRKTLVTVEMNLACDWLWSRRQFSGPVTISLKTPLFRTCWS